MYRLVISAAVSTALNSLASQMLPPCIPALLVVGAAVHPVLGWPDGVPPGCVCGATITLMQDAHTHHHCARRRVRLEQD